MNTAPRDDPFDPSADYRPSAQMAAAMAAHRAGCRCTLHGRRLFSAALLSGAALPALAQDGVTLESQSKMTQLVPAEKIEEAAAQQYRQMLREAAQQRALAPADHPQLIRLRAIAERLIPHVNSPNLRSTPRAAQWRWEVNLIGSKEINAFCMPGGKIAFYYGILQELQLNDDEVAQIMGHEMAHALREHAREQLAKTTATRFGANLISSLLGWGNLGDVALGVGAQLLTLSFSRNDESEADKVGLDLAARGGYNPRAGVTLWEKMAVASRGAPIKLLSTHPSGPDRIRDIQGNLPAVEPLYRRAPKPPREFGPPRGG